MKPKELIIANIDAFLLAPLTAAGLKFSPGQLTFKRQQSDFMQTIHFQSSRYNEEHFCVQFWSHYQVSSRSYTTWHQARYGREPTNNIMGGVADWNISNWQFPVIDGKQDKEHQLVDPAHRTAVMAGKQEKALWALNEGLAYWEKNPKASYPQGKEEIALRMEKYAHA